MRSRTALTAATAVAIAAAGVGAGAGLYATLAPATTTTVISTPGGTQPVSETSNTTIADIYKATYQGVVDIKVSNGAGVDFPPFGGGAAQAEGSGFVYDKNGDIVTNEHVVIGETSITVTFWNGKTAQATLVGSDSATDLAVIHVDDHSSLLRPLDLANSSRVQVGDPVIAIGSPFGLAETVTSGIVSALHRPILAQNGFTIPDSIQTDTPINHGNSGGPLIDALGLVVGVNAQIQSESGGNEGVAFAIPSNTVSKVAAALVAGKTVAHAYLGIGVETSLTPPGVSISSVNPGTPAARAGLRFGDVIVKLDATKILTPEDFSAVVNGKKPGDALKVTFIRGASQRTITLRLAKETS